MTSQGVHTLISNFKLGSSGVERFRDYDVMRDNRFLKF